MKPWFEASLAKVSKGGKLGEALRYGLRHWDGLCRFLDDGRIEIDSNCVERSIRGLALIILLPPPTRSRVVTKDPTNPNAIAIGN